MASNKKTGSKLYTKQKEHVVSLSHFTPVERLTGISKRDLIKESIKKDYNG